MQTIEKCIYLTRPRLFRCLVFIIVVTLILTLQFRFRNRKSVGDKGRFSYDFQFITKLTPCYTVIYYNKLLKLL